MVRRNEEKISGPLMLWRISFKRENGREANAQEYQEQKADLIVNIRCPEEYNKTLLNELIEKPGTALSDVRN